MDMKKNGPDIEITQHIVQNKSLTPGITMKHKEHQGQSAEHDWVSRYTDEAGWMPSLSVSLPIYIYEERCIQKRSI